MGLFHKDTNDPRVEQYKQEFISYISSVQNKNELYKAFTEITILRLQLDKNDKFFRNLNDRLERKGVFDVKELIVLQFNDIMSTCKSYQIQDYDLIDSVMDTILSNNEDLKSSSNSIWAWLKAGLDKATGRKK